MEYVPLLILFAIFSAIFAGQKNRSSVGWFFVGLLLGPFGLLVLAFPEIKKRDLFSHIQPGQIKHPVYGYGPNPESVESLVKIGTLNVTGIAIEKIMSEDEVESQITKLYQNEKLTRDETERVLIRELTLTEVEGCGNVQSSLILTLNNSTRSVTDCMLIRP